MMSAVAGICLTVSMLVNQPIHSDPSPPSTLTYEQGKAMAKAFIKPRISLKQYLCLRDLWNHESHWNYRAGSIHGPYGIPQANPGTKMASKGDDWRTNPITQVRWGMSYIRGRYETPCRAWNHYKRYSWY